MDLDVSPVRTSGRAAAADKCEVLRDLTLADLPSLDRPRETKPGTVAKLRDSHHSVARLIAEGHRSAEIQVITGYSASRISILQADPAFQELVTFYRENKSELYADLHTRMQSLSLEVLEELRDRLHDTPDDVSTSQLLEALKLTADRTGHGPKTTQVNVNVEIADRLRAARHRAEALRAPMGEGGVQPGAALPHTIIDVTPEKPSE